MFFLEIEEEQIKNEWWWGGGDAHNYLLFLLHRQPAPGTHKHIHKCFVNAVGLRSEYVVRVGGVFI